MTTATATPVPTTPSDERPARAARTIAPIPLTRLMGVELRKMFDTRAGFWLMASVGIVTVLASAAVILWAPDDAITFETFATAMGMPMSVILPMIGILSITSEYSQRTGLTTYTLVPWRGRVVLSKLLVVLGIGVASMVVALGVGAVGTLVGSAITGLDPVWNITAEQFGLIVLGNLIGMLMGFMLGTVIRSSPAAIVAYFVYALVLPGALGALAAFQQWFADLQPWVDVNYATIPLFEGNVTGENWLQLAITTTVWLWIPLAVGLRAVLRAEVK